MMKSTKATKSRHDYAVAWIAALPMERASAIAMLDEEHGRPHNFRQPPTDPNAYTWGTVEEHNVVILSLASGVYGNVMAAVTVSELLSSFPNIKFGLLVGMGAGIPRKRYDVRLGDVVVSFPMGTSSGIIQYDLGKAKADGAWERKDSFNRPPELLLKAISALQASYDLLPSSNTGLVQEAANRHPHWGKTYVHAEKLPDRLFKAAYHHPVDVIDCSNCDSGAEIQRIDRDSEEPFIHYGIIASGNSLVKDAETREKIAALDLNCICLEMEAAGLVNSLPCLVIRGICDYADTHKNDSWQRLASARAAAYAKELLGHTAPVHHGEVSTALVQSRSVPRARRHGRAKQMSGQGKTNEQIVRLLQSLHKCPYAERKNRNIKRVAGTCEWFTNHTRFKDWYSQRASSLLWVSADPGCGKSVLARYLVDEVFPAPNRFVCYFFFKDDSSEQRSASIAMCALLHQLIERDRELLKHHAVKKLLTSRDSFDDAFSDIWSTLMAVIADQKNVGEIIFVLDALDECSDSDRKTLVEAISEVDFDGPTRARFKLLLTSRPYNQIQRSFKMLESRMPVIHLSGEGPEEVAQISEEIGLVIEHTVHQISREKQLTPEEHDFLLEHLTSVENRTYLWVHLIIDIIRKNTGFNRGDVRRAITELPSSVDEAYENILNRCSDVEKARKIFTSLLVAEGALTVEHISVILAIRGDEGTMAGNMETNFEPTDRMTTIIRDLCGFFVVIKNSEVHFLHQTAREFLIGKDSDTEEQQAKASMIKTSNIGTTVWKHSFDLRKCHKFLASGCVRFLQTGRRLQKTYTFRDYAALHWDLHMYNAFLGKADPLIAVGLELCSYEKRSLWLDQSRDNGSNHKNEDLAIENSEKKTKVSIHNERLVDPRFSPPFILAAWLGIEAIVQLALDQGMNVNTSDTDGTTALWWAAHQDHEDIAQALLARGAQFDGDALFPDMNPLHKAAASGGYNTAKLLLSHGAKVNVRDARGAQPLHHAAGFGRKNVVELLVSSGAQVEGKDQYGATPLHSAAAWGYLETIRTLIEQAGAKVNSVTKLGLTPLSDAVREQDTRVVDVLIDAGANINWIEKDGTTPLIYAAQNDLIPLAKHLIGKGAKIDEAGIIGTALCQALANGHIEMMELLLNHGANVNWANEWRTSVSFWLEFLEAPRSKIHTVIKMLIDRGAKLDAANRFGRTTILQCCFGKRTKVVKLLCRFQADVNGVIGHSNLIKIDSQFSSYQGWTALHAAAFMADESLIYYLLSHGANTDIVDAHNHTPLFWAMIGCVDNIGFNIKESDSDSNSYWQSSFFWTSLGINGPLKGIVSGKATAWEHARKDKLRKLYPEGYQSAQHTTVRLLLENGADPRIKGINWRYSLLPGLRKFKKKRALLFQLLKQYQDKPPGDSSRRTLPRDTEEDDRIHRHEIESWNEDSSGFSIKSSSQQRVPHALEVGSDDDNEQGEKMDQHEKVHLEGYEEGSEDEQIEANKWEEEIEAEIGNSGTQKKNNNGHT